MGGGIVLDVALRFPEHVAGLGLVATGARLRVAPVILEGIEQDFQAAVRLISDWAFGPDVSPEMRRLGCRQMSETPARVLHGDFSACDDFDVMDRLGEIRVPALVVCGRQDRLTPAKYAVYLRDHIPDAKLHLVDGAGHMVMVEQPGAVARALASFLSQV
jgi:pimeloyl-ACP methyl ester carboxylesterase